MFYLLRISVINYLHISESSQWMFWFHTFLHVGSDRYFRCFGKGPGAFGKKEKKSHFLIFLSKSLLWASNRVHLHEGADQGMCDWGPNRTKVRLPECTKLLGESYSSEHITTNDFTYVCSYYPFKSLTCHSTFPPMWVVYMNLIQ